MSATQIPDLWPTSVKVEILTPYAILRAQATKLTERTQSIVEGQVRSRAVAPSLICHTFDLIAPVLSFRYTLLRLWHRETMVYPVLLTAGLDKSLNPNKIAEIIEGNLIHKPLHMSREEAAFLLPPAPGVSHEASALGTDLSMDEAALLGSLSRIFADASTGTVISSLIARTNESRDGVGPVLEPDDTPGTDDGATEAGSKASDDAEE